MRTYFVYILTNRSGTLYVGVTGDLAYRLWAHRSGLVRGFAAKYQLDRLVYAEEHPTARDAIAREKQLKGWRRSKKVALIESQNPTWQDLSPSYPFEPKRRRVAPRTTLGGPSTSLARFASSLRSG